MKKLSNVVIFYKDCQKEKFLRYLKVMISKFCDAGHLILIFMRRISPSPRPIWTFQGVSLNTCTCLNGGDNKN